MSSRIENVLTEPLLSKAKVVELEQRATGRIPENLSGALYSSDTYHKGQEFARHSPVLALRTLECRHECTVPEDLREEAWRRVAEDVHTRGRDSELDECLLTYLFWTLRTATDTGTLSVAA